MAGGAAARATGPLHLYRPPAVAGGVLYCQSMHAWWLTAFDAEQGQLLFSHQQDLPVHTVPHYAPVVVDGVLYLCHGRGGVSALE